MKLICQLDDYDRHVLAHCNEHLSDCLGLSNASGLALDDGNLSHALDKLADVLAELFLHLLSCGRCVLYDIMQQSRTDCVAVHVELHCQSLGNCKGMDDIGLSAFTLLVAMHLIGILCRHADLLIILVMVVLAYFCQKSGNQCFVHRQY